MPITVPRMLLRVILRIRITYRLGKSVLDQKTYSILYVFWSKIDFTNRYVIEAKGGQGSTIKQCMEKGEREGKRPEARTYKAGT